MVDRFAHNWKSDSDGWPKSYMEPYDDGAYVRYTDYAALHQKLDGALMAVRDLQQQLAAAREALQAAEAGARRWIFVRDHRDVVIREAGGFYKIEDYGTSWLESADAAVDEAIATLQRDRQP